MTWCSESEIRHHIPVRGARLARRDDRKYWVYLRKEQRRQAGCPARKMVSESLTRDTKRCPLIGWPPHGRNGRWRIQTRFGFDVGLLGHTRRRHRRFQWIGHDGRNRRNGGVEHEASRGRGVGR